MANQPFVTFNIIESDFVPPDEVILIGRDIFVLTIVPFFFRIYEFDEAVEHYKKYVLDKLFKKYDRLFAEMPKF